MSAAGVGAGGRDVPAAAPTPRELEPRQRGIFAVLVLACIGAFFLTQHLKHTPTVVQEFKLTPFFSPYPRGHEKEEAISFKLEHADRVTVRVINTAGDVVATLLRGWPVARYKTFSLRWNGRRGVARRYAHGETATGRPVLIALPGGPIAATGEYRVEVHLLRQKKTVLSTKSFTLVAG